MSQFSVFSVQCSVKTVAITVIVLLLLIGGGVLGLYHASQHVPDFYQQALKVGSEEAHTKSDEMLQRIAALASDVQKPGKWQAVFTEAQLNGWLAIDRVENHADALPPEWMDPRVHIEGNQLVVACRYQGKHVHSIISLTLEPYLAHANVLAVRVGGAHAGHIPLPLKRILDAIDDAVHHTSFRIEWRQANGDPVAQISLPPPREHGTAVQLDAFHIRDGKIVIAGRR